MVGKTPESIVAVRPLKDGVIADFDTVEMMLHYFIRKVHMQRLMAPHPRVVIGIPSGVTEVEKHGASSLVPISWPTSEAHRSTTQSADGLVRNACSMTSRVASRQLSPQQGRPVTPTTFRSSMRG